MSDHSDLGSPYLRIEREGSVARVDRMTFEASLEGAEVVEGFTAFVEKRTPSWVPEDFRREGRL